MVSQGGAVIFNPVAGRGQGARLRADAQQRLGDAFTWIATTRSGHAAELAREAATKQEVVVAFGGDGTVGDVARGILGTNATLGILPVGTGNDFARNLGLPLDMPEACATILGGNVRRIDVGIINGQPFVNNAGLGFDSQVMTTMNTSIRFTRGRPAFILAILKTILTFKAFRMTLTADDGIERPYETMLVSILNGKVYGAGMMAAPHAEMDDGRVDVMIVKNLSRLQRLSVLLKIQSGQHLTHPAVELIQTRTLALTTIPPQPLNIDGEVRGLTPIALTVENRALRVLVR
jgi:YegS/Rv2252/BmrU family lipid kinase